MKLSDFLKSFDKPIEKQMKRENSLELADGTYEMELVDAYHGEKNGYEHFMFSLKVASGEEEGMRENIFTPLETTTRTGKDMPEYVINKSIYLIRAIGHCVGLEVTPDMFDKETTTEIYETLREEFMDYRGSKLMLTIYTKPNNNNPEYPYRNYLIKEASKSIQEATEIETEFPF